MSLTAEGKAALIWFGAGISIAEIISGTYFAPLGLKRAVAAIAIGHVIGFALLFAAGYIGARTHKSAMETTKMSYGVWGARFFATLNVLQLVGWTGIMIYDGSSSIRMITSSLPRLWPLVIGGLIVLWLAVGISNIARLNVVSLTLLFALSLVMCKVVFFGRGGVMAGGAGVSQALSFGAAVELSVAMPLSWLPLLGDYTREATRPRLMAAVSSAVYCATSAWMYIIGLGAAIFTGEGDIAHIMAASGLGWAALIIVVLSTVTTTFLDAASAGISCVTIHHKASARVLSIATALVGTVGAILFPLDDITGFLYLIGSVFCPMAAVQIADYYILHTDVSGKRIDIVRALLWLAGFVLYRVSLGWSLPVGNTLPVMVIVGALTVVVGKVGQAVRKVRQ